MPPFSRFDSILSRSASHTRSLFLAVLAVILGIGVAPPPSAQAQEPEMASYYDQARFLEAPSSVFREGLLGFANPAASALSEPQTVFAWSSPGGDDAGIGDWGVFSGLGGLGTSFVRIRRDAGTPLRTQDALLTENLEATGYSVTLSGGSDGFALGAGFQGFTGDATALGRYNRVTLGGIARPSRYLSLGLTGNLSVETDDTELVGALGLRPFGNSRLTLFADAALADGQAVEDALWSAGATAEVVRGVDVVGRVFENESFGLGLRVELGRVGLGSQVSVDEPTGAPGRISRVRLGTDVPSAIGDAVQAGDKRVELKPTSVPYRGPRFSFGGSPSPRFYEVIRTLERAAENPRVSTVALDLTDLSLSREKAWEIRREIEAVQGQEKTVVAFVESAAMDVYHVASAADRVVMDPEGSLTLPGYASSRTYLKRTLDKLGLGVQVFRYFEYKSAFETFSRTGFSEADSLQRQQLVDAWYDLTRDDVAESRGLSADTLDRIIDEETILDARQARQAGLVDTLARWHERDDVLKAVTGEDTGTLSVDRLNDLATASRQWGKRPEIAVIYGIGSTSVGSGMEAKKLAKQFRDLAGDDDVDAVVFRVDSPGGSSLAADIVAQAVRETAEKKPVIISQGTVAASGGYAVSAFGDRILAGPNTVTGSIGVIGLWVYDAGLFSERAEFSYDVVKRGDRAELFAPYRVPFVGLPLPQRKLGDDELERVRTLIERSYDQFVSEVATGRDTSEAYVREIGEGRVYTGLDAKERALVDEIGGLARAVVVAQREAGLRGEEVRIREVNPSTGFLDLPDVLPFGLGTWGEEDEPSETTPGVEFVRTVLENQPTPLMILPPGYYE